MLLLEYLVTKAVFPGIIRSSNLTKVEKNKVVWGAQKFWRSGITSYGDAISRVKFLSFNIGLRSARARDGARVYPELALSNGILVDPPRTHLESNVN